MLDRISKADRISLAGAIVLFIGLFLPWYKPDVGDLGGGVAGGILERAADSVSVDAFEALKFIDILLLVLAIGAAALIVLVAMSKVDESLHAFVEILGSVAALLVLFRIVIQPDFASLKWGIFVAFLGAAAIAGGQLLDRMGKI